jgi:hypothetical protein
VCQGPRRKAGGRCRQQAEESRFAHGEISSTPDACWEGPLDFKKLACRRESSNVGWRLRASEGKREDRQRV